jgi:hypothetical protein
VKSATIFVCSDDVGPYVNVVSYLKDKRSISRFTFVFLTGAMTESPQTAFVDAIVEALEKLGEGKYKGREVDVPQDERTRYMNLAQDLRSCPDLVISITMEQLPGYLAGQQSMAKPDRPVIDVTGLPKILMAHVLLICIAHGHSVHAFELRNRINRSRPELSLYNFLPAGGFDYPPLNRDPTVLNSFGKLVPARRIMWSTVVVTGVGLTCFAILLLVDPTNLWLVEVGLAANVLGISGAILQGLSMRDG